MFHVTIAVHQYLCVMVNGSCVCVISPLTLTRSKSEDLEMARVGGHSYRLLTGWNGDLSCLHLHMAPNLWTLATGCCAHRFRKQNHYLSPVQWFGLPFRSVKRTVGCMIGRCFVSNNPNHPVKAF